jgi:hypothetical protein
MILDDVFVNSDAGRTKIACRVLRDFAKQGHQLLVFTCHEHVWRMFQELNIDSRRIPSRFGEADPVVEEPQPEPVPEPVAAEPEPVALSPPPITVEAKPEPAPPVIEAPAAAVEESQDELIEVPVEPEPVPMIAEVEYRWDTHWSQDASRLSDRDGAVSTDWLPETVMRPPR